MRRNKLYLRLATKRELTIINNFLKNNWYLDLERLFRQKTNNSLLIYIFEGYFNEVYGVKPSFKYIIDKLQKRGKHPYALGLHMGRFRRNKFIPSLELGYMVSRSTNACVIVNTEGEKNFLYGKDLLIKSIIDVKSPIQKGQIVILLNREEEYIGLGKALESITKKNNRIITKQTGFIIKNIVDLGWYLRRGG